MLLLKSRKDVLLKSILRSIRRYYLSLFIKTTQFNPQSRKKSAELYQRDISIFVSTLIPEFGEFWNAINYDIGIESDLEIELNFVFCSMFYPKLMILKLMSEKERRDIKNVRSCCYSYSDKVIKQLLRKYQSLKLIF